MKYCTKCGNKLKDEDSFCSKCGTNQANEDIELLEDSVMVRSKINGDMPKIADSVIQRSTITQIGKIEQFDRGNIENYYKMMIDSLERGDQAKAKEFWMKAKEIDIDKATKYFDKHKKEIAQAYLKIANDELKNFKQIKPIYGGYGILINEAIISQSGNKIEIALNNADSYHINKWSYYLRGKYILELNEKYFMLSVKHKKETKNKAYNCFMKCLEIDPNFENAIKALKKSGFSCKDCKGTGECIYCQGNGKCNNCNGSGNCEKCNGNGTISGLFGKIKICNVCRGTKVCKYCNGSGICTNCEGTGDCESCNGRGVK